MNAAGCLKALCMAGRIILENGGETYRAEDTVTRMAQALGLSEPDVFAVPSGLFISFTDESGERRTSVSRVYLRGTHLSRVDRVNQLSRMLSMGELPAERLIGELRQAERLGDELKWWFAPLAAFISAMGFAVMFGGGPVEMLLGGVCAALTQLVPLVLPGRSDSSMISTLIGGMICVFLPMCFQAATGLGVIDTIVASAIMPLVPGLSMTNAVQDIMRGDMMSGVAHCARAIMVAGMVAGGALVATRVFDMLELTSPESVQYARMPFWLESVVMFLSSAVASAGFGLLLYVPRRALLSCGMIAGLGYAVYWLVLQAGTAETAAMFFGALIASFGAQLAARRLRMIATIFVTIAIIPLVPGLGLYRAMSALAQSQLDLGGSIASHSMALIMMIALGIALGSALCGLPRRPGSGKGACA